jgi:predicted AAA+ superfamily ATPase
VAQYGEQINFSSVSRDCQVALSTVREYYSILEEIIRLNDYHQKDWKLSFWRTSHGAEVDILISRGTKLLYAIECKYTKQPSTSHLSGLRSFHEKYLEIPCYIVAPVAQPSRLSFARVLPPHRLLQEL